MFVWQAVLRKIKSLHSWVAVFSEVAAGYLITVWHSRVQLWLFVEAAFRTKSHSGLHKAELSPWRSVVVLTAVHSRRLQVVC